MTFRRDLAKFKKRTIEKYLKVKRLSSHDLFSAIVLETPVDKGVLRNNWFAELGTPSTETTDRSDKAGQGTIQRIDSILNGTDLARDIFLTNGLPYAYRIEFDGWSGKAPLGMVRVNTLRWNDIVRNNVRQVNSNAL